MSHPRRDTVLIALLVAVGALGILLCAQALHDPSGLRGLLPHHHELLGQTLPDAAAVTLEGAPLDLRAACAEHGLVLSLWSRRCGYCRRELAEWNGHACDVPVLALNVEDSRDDAVKAWREIGATMPGGVASQEFRQRFDAPGLPITLVFDTSGTCRIAELGYESPGRLSTLCARALALSPSRTAASASRQPATSP